MPNILVKIPHGAYPGEARATLQQQITQAAATAEQIPADPRNRFISWVVLEESAAGMWACGGVDVSAHVLPCIAVVYVPAGVLDAAARALFVRLVHDAFQQALPATETRQLATSVILHDVPDGSWGGNGSIQTLAAITKMAGFAHLAHLTTGA